MTDIRMGIKIGGHHFRDYAIARFTRGGTLNHVGYLTPGFECFPGGFAHEVDQRKQTMDQNRTHRALSNEHISSSISLTFR